MPLALIAKRGAGTIWGKTLADRAKRGSELGLKALLQPASSPGLDLERKRALSSSPPVSAAWEALEQAQMRSENSHTTAWHNLSEVQRTLGTTSHPEMAPWHPLHPRYLHGFSPLLFLGCFFQQKNEPKPLSIRTEMVGACFELSPLIFLLDKQLSGELKAIHSRLLNGTPRKRQFWGNMGRIPNTGRRQR